MNESELRRRLSLDVSKGLRTEDVTWRSIARLPFYHKPDTIKIDTNGKTVQMIADEIKKV